MELNDRKESLLPLSSSEVVFEPLLGGQEEGALLSRSHPCRSCAAEYLTVTRSLGTEKEIKKAELISDESG